jgi:galactose-1-phosphate uridylyltransferase
METPYKEALMVLKQREDTELEKKREYLVNQIVNKLEQVKTQEQKLYRVKEELENLKKMKAEDVVLPTVGSNSICATVTTNGFYSYGPAKVTWAKSGFKTIG